MLIEEHGLEHTDTSGPVRYRHLGKTAAFDGDDGADAEIDRNPARSLIHHDSQAPFHLVFLYHIKFAVAAKDQDARHATINDIVYLLSRFRLVNTLLCTMGVMMGTMTPLIKSVFICFLSPYYRPAPSISVSIL